MRILETMACPCSVGRDRPRMTCADCNGTGQKPLVGTGHLWVDGRWRDEPPPSEERVVLRCFERTDDHSVRPAPTSPQRPPVPRDFAWTDRAMLRRFALEAALKAGGLLGSRPRTGAELLAEAEEIEKWVAEANG